jgi:hypothetical protein
MCDSLFLNENNLVAKCVIFFCVDYELILSSSFFFYRMKARAKRVLLKFTRFMTTCYILL